MNIIFDKVVAGVASVVLTGIWVAVIACASVSVPVGATNFSPPAPAADRGPVLESLAGAEKELYLAAKSNGIVGDFRIGRITVIR